MKTANDNLIEFLTEHGTYWVTPEDAALLRQDLGGFGTMAIHTMLEGDRVIGKRAPPDDIFGFKRGVATDE